MMRKLYLAIAISAITSPAISENELPRPIASATVVLLAIHFEKGTHVTISNDVEASIDGRNVYFVKTEDDPCTFQMLELDSPYFGVQINFAKLSNEYRTARNCLGNLCGYDLLVSGTDGAMCGGYFSKDAINRKHPGFERSSCYTNLYVQRRQIDEIQRVVRAVKRIHDQLCPAAELPP